MKTIVIIPARGGSKRIPNKNTLLLGDMPLLSHSIQYAKKHSFVDAVFVSTNDTTIKKIAIEYGANVIDRPNLLAGDLEPTSSALKHTLEMLPKTIEHVILLQPTNPLRPEKLLEEAFYIYQQKGCNSLFTVSRSHQKLGKINNGLFKPFNYTIGQRSQDLEPLYFENGLLYIANSNLILEQIIICEKAFPLEINHIFATVDIDTEIDFEYANFLYQKYNTKK
jgi:N-acylneuraminate cytidylyltransferase